MRRRSGQPGGRDWAALAREIIHACNAEFASIALRVADAAATGDAVDAVVAAAVSEAEPALLAAVARAAQPREEDGDHD